MGTAIAAAHQSAGLEPAFDSGIIFVTANLDVQPWIPRQGFGLDR